MLNYIALMGRLTKDVELRYTSNNTPVASFSIAVERDIATKGKECGAFWTTDEAELGSVSIGGPNGED